MRRLLAHAHLALTAHGSGEWFLRTLLVAMLVGLALGLLIGVRLVLAQGPSGPGPRLAAVAPAGPPAPGPAQGADRR